MLYLPVRTGDAIIGPDVFTMTVVNVEIFRCGDPHAIVTHHNDDTHLFFHRVEIGNDIVAPAPGVIPQADGPRRRRTGRVGRASQELPRWERLDPE